MSKQNDKQNAASAQKSGPLDWNAEAASVHAFAKQQGGSRGDYAAKVAEVAKGDTPAGELIRKHAGERGAAAITELPRNVLAKLPKLAACIASKAPWCSAGAVGPEGRRKEDASVVVALAPMLKDGAEASQRQKSVIADAINRYPGGAGAQMPASLDALAFFGIVERKQAGGRNAEYALKDRKRAVALIPQS